jgi:cell division initiation protein
MRLQKADINQKHFSTRLRGFAREDVKAFLEALGESFEELLRENAGLKEEVRDIKNQIEEYEDLETAMQDTLVKTMVFVDTYMKNARKEAEKLQDEAALYIEELLKEARYKVVMIHEDISHFKGIRKHFKEEMKRTIAGSLDELELRQGK